MTRAGPRYHMQCLAFWPLCSASSAEGSASGKILTRSPTLRVFPTVFCGSVGPRSVRGAISGLLCKSRNAAAVLWSVLSSDASIVRPCFGCTSPAAGRVCALGVPSRLRKVTFPVCGYLLSSMRLKCWTGACTNVCTGRPSGIAWRCSRISTCARTACSCGVVCQR